MVQTAMASQRARPGLQNADEYDLARCIMMEPDVVWHVCEAYARTNQLPVEQLPVSRLRGLIGDIVLSKLPRYD